MSVKRWRPKQSLFLGMVAFCGLLVTGCGEGGFEPGDEPITDPSFIGDVRPILVSPTCSSSQCHSAAARAGGLSLASVQVSDLVGVTGPDGEVLVIPGDSQDSYLIRKLEGRSIQGSQMPLGDPALSNGTIQTIRNWIDQGAPRN